MADPWQHSGQKKAEGPILFPDVQWLARDANLDPAAPERDEDRDQWVLAPDAEDLFEKRRRWFYTCRGKEFGPVTGTQLRELAVAGMLEPTDFVWREGFDRWRKAKRLIGLFPPPQLSREAPAPKNTASRLAAIRRFSLLALAISLLGVGYGAAYIARSSHRMPASVAETTSPQDVPDVPRTTDTSLVPSTARARESSRHAPQRVESRAEGVVPAVGGQKLSDAYAERSIGLIVHERLVKDQRALPPSPLLARLEAAALRMLDLRERKDLKYHFVVLDSDAVNAFSHVGGYVYVSRGLFNLVANDVELAWIVGHEIAHLHLRHGSARASQATDGMNLDPAGRVYEQIAAGYTADEEYAADEWVTRKLAGLGYSHRQCTSFPKRYRDYLARRALRDATAAAIPSPGPSASGPQVDRHWLTLPSPDSRLDRLEKLRDLSRLATDRDAR